MSNEEHRLEIRADGDEHRTVGAGAGSRGGEAVIRLYGTDIRIFTPAEAKEILGCSATQVSRLCASLGAPQLGKFYLINDELLDAMKERRGKRGRPRKTEE